MEENNTPNLSEGRSDVGFPEPKKEKKSSKLPLILIVIVILGLLGGGAYFLFTKPSEIEDETGTVSLTTPTDAQAESPTPTETQVDREEISVSVLNGTAISGLAGKVKTALEKLGYKEIETGNASKKDYEVTEVKFASSIPTSVKEEILDELNSTFEEVKTVSGSPTGADVEIITGFPKDHTVTPTTKAATATPKPTGSTTPTVTGTITVTPTKTPTPTQLPLSN